MCSSVAIGDGPQWWAMQPIEEPSFYDAVGGGQTFHAIVSRFYQLVADDDILAPMYPADDMDGAEDRLRMFLEQYWGGPRRSEEHTSELQSRGHLACRLLLAKKSSYP